MDGDSTSPKRFRIAFSFAGEKRDFIAEVAAILARRFGEAAILYDRYHEAEFANWKLGLLLQELYHDRSELIVVVVCPDYSTKDWCGLEWLAIHSMLKAGKHREIMLCRFEHAKLQGLYENAGHVELDAKTPEQTAALILERLALNEGKPKQHYTADATSSRLAQSSTPHNLPRLQSFFGREKELAAIREALEPESRTWGALIDGPGGMGKTSLAVRAAHDCPPGQFRRIIFVSVKDREMDDDGERKLTGFILPGFLELLNELARELGHPDITKAPEDQRIRLLLDALRPAQALLILDNLESLPKTDRDQLFTFVKRLPQGCKAILTSRRRIGSGSELLVLEKLDQHAALETLADLARHNSLLARTSETERIALYEQTGGKPLLLRWVAGQLGRGSCRTIADALCFLRSCPPDNDPLEFIFGDLAKEFTEDEVKVLVALAYFSLPARIEHIVTLAGVETAFAETALRTLSNRSLVVPDEEETAFALVPMVAEFLRRKRPEVVATTGSRLENQAYALIVENGEQTDRFPVLDAAWPTIAAALPLFLSGANQQLQVVHEALNEFLDFTGRWDERLSLCEHAEAKAIAVDDFYSAGWYVYDAGMVHFRRAQAAELLVHADRAALHWTKAPLASARERAATFQMRGRGHRFMEDYRAAIVAFREALKLDRNASPGSIDVAIALNDLARAEGEAGDLAGAERGHREALRMARSLRAQQTAVVALNGLSRLALQQKDWQQAVELAREAAPLAEGLGRRELIAFSSWSLAEALLRLGRPAEAVPHAQRAAGIYAELGSPGVERARGTLAECEACLSRLP